MRLSNEQLLKEVIEDLVNSYKLKDNLNEIEIKSLWMKIAGGMISKHTKKLMVKNKTLYIELDSAALKQELSYSKEKIINNIGKNFVENVIDEIVFI